MNINKNNEHQIIFPGEVISRYDPKMLGRVRAKPIYSEYVSEMLKSVGGTYLRDDEKDLKPEFWWTEKDIFVFLPLLPFYISQVPDEGEYVHIIYQNKKFLFGNQFYIQGPFSSPMNSDFETRPSSESILSAGDRYKLGINLKNNFNVFDNDISYGIFPEPGDNALLGRGSADVIVKPEEVLIRAGKTITSDLTPQDYPKAKNSRAFLQLSNFLSQSVQGKTETNFDISKVINKLKRIIIWNIDSGVLGNSANNFSGSITLHRMLDTTSATTDNFKLGSIETLTLGTDYGNEIEGIKFSNKTMNEVIYICNTFIDTLFGGTVLYSNSVVNSRTNFLGIDRFPFAVSPSKITYQEGITLSEHAVTSDVKESANFFDLMKGIKVKSNNFQTGCFVVSDNLNNVPTIGPSTKTNRREDTKIDVYSSPITYSVLGGQKLYLLSHNITGPKGRIDLTNTIYGIPDIEFTKPGGIHDKTYPTVRGDELIKLLRKIFEFVKGHVHSVSTKPPVEVSSGNGQTTLEIDQLLSDAENTILNQEIRIN
jgi:hypothetical protein